MTPLWLLLAGGRSATVRAALPAIVAITVAILATMAAPDPVAAPVNRPIELAVDDYVGSTTCRACHPGEHASWHSSYHRTMTQVASRETIRASFGEADRLELDFHGQPVVLTWRDSELWVELDQRQPAQPGVAPQRVARPVVQVTGSHHAQVLWYATGNERQLGAVPMVYRIAEERWLPINAVFLMPPNIKQAPAHGTWNGNCISCHTTNAMPRVDTDRTDTQVAEFGISCEACHGPGRDHVTANRSPLRRYALHLDSGADDDDTVIEPGQLESPRRSEVCGQCHSVSIVRRAHFDSWREHGSPFRPGEVLDDAQLVVTPAVTNAPELHGQLQRDPEFFRNTFWADGQVRVTGREFNGLLASPCHARGHGDRVMSCLSCHSMHQQRSDRRPPHHWANAQLRPDMDGDTACTQCHPRFKDPAQLTAHTHHAADSVSCYDCHMPRTSYGLLKAVRDHVISSPAVRTELQTGRPNACNLCHLDQTLLWTDEHLQRWFGAEPASLDADQRQFAAGVRWMLTGDAAQRALTAYSAGTTASQRAAGTEWLPPFLGQLLADPYYAVRFIAQRSLRSLGVEPPGNYDFLAAESVAMASARHVQSEWAATARHGPTTAPRLLMDAQGLRLELFQRLLARRNDRPVLLAE